MIEEAKFPPHPLLRDGTSRGTRSNPALSPETTKIDNRSIADLLVWSVGYAQELPYFNQMNLLVGNWRVFWEKDISAVIADIDSKRPPADGALFQEIENYRRLEAVARISTTDAKMRISRFRELCDQLLAIPKQFENWHRRVEKGLGLWRYLDETIQAVLRPAVIKLQQYDLGAENENGQNEPLGLDYDGLKIPWNLPEAAPDPSIYQGINLDERLDNAIQRLAFLFDGVQSVYVRLINSAGLWMEESLQSWPRHEPHFALFLAFLLHFQHAQRHLNGITGRHLDFYYERVLRLGRKDSDPDQAHLIFTAAPHSPYLPLEAGTRFSAGKDETGVETHYQLIQDFVVNQADVTDLKALFVDPVEQDSDAQIAFRASPTANSRDGKGAPLDETKPRWKTFGHDSSRDQAPVGFAIASPMLFLAEGERTITATFAVTNELEKIDQMLFQDLFAETEPDVLGLLEVSLSTEEGWFVVPGDAENLSIEAVEVPKKADTPAQSPIPPDPTAENLARVLDETVAGLQVDEDAEVELDDTLIPAIQIEIKLGPGDPPITVFKGTEEIPAIDAQWPVLRVRTIGTISKTLYHGLSKATVRRIDLEVAVLGMRNLILQTDLGPVKPDKPFLPFGPVPKKGSALLIGSWEAFQKNLISLVARVEWMEVPKSLYEHYKEYASEAVVPNNAHFRGRVLLYDQSASGQWTENDDDLALFLSIAEEWIMKGNARIAEGNEKIRQGNTKIIQGNNKIAQAAETRRLGEIDRTNGTNTVTAGWNEVFAGHSDLNYGNSIIQQGHRMVRESRWMWWAWIWVGWHHYHNGLNHINWGVSLVNNAYARIRAGADQVGAGYRKIALGNIQVANAAVMEAEGKTTRKRGQDMVSYESTDEDKKGGEQMVVQGIGWVDYGKNLKDQDSTPGIEIYAKMQDYGRMPNLPPFTGFAASLPRGFLKIETKQTFYHELFPTIFADRAILKTKNDTQVLPNTPFTPTLKWVALDYRAYQSIDVTQAPAEEVERFYHLHPFGQRLAFPRIGNGVPEPFKLVPRYDVTHISEALVVTNPYGALYIGVENLAPPQNLSLLIQVVEGSADPELIKPEVTWCYLAGDDWVKFDERELLTERTSGLIRSGVVTFVIPKAADLSHQLLPAGKVWLKAEVKNNLNGVTDLAAVRPQAALVEFIDQGNDPERLQTVLSAGTIAKKVIKDAALKAVEQPFASFGGRVIEAKQAYYQRVSEHLRHKDRAVTIWDYERLVLEHFPSVYKVKCISHTDSRKEVEYSEYAPGAVTVVVIANLRNQSGVDQLAPRASLAKLMEIEEFLKARVSPFVAGRLRVVNPKFEKIKTNIHVQFKWGEDPGLSGKKLEEDLKRFLSPWAFDQEQDIEFGGSIHASAMVDFVDERDFVDAVLDFSMTTEKEGDRFPTDVQEAVASTARSILVSDSNHKIIWGEISGN